jgi:hydrogenase nickel incorporation protein HypA/HybF
LAVHLKLGPLAGVVKEALVPAFEMARAESELPEAALVIEAVPIRIHCPRCQAERDVVSIQEIVCAQCGTPSADVTQGRDLQVVALELA